MKKYVLVFVLLFYSSYSFSQNQNAYDTIAAKLASILKGAVDRGEMLETSEETDLFADYCTSNEDEIQKIFINYSVKENTSLDTIIKALIENSYDLFKSKYLPTLNPIDDEDLQKDYDILHKDMCDCANKAALNENKDTLLMQLRKCTEELKSNKMIPRFQSRLQMKGVAYTNKVASFQLLNDCKLFSDFVKSAAYTKARENLGSSSTGHLFTEDYYLKFMDFYLTQNLSALEKRVPNYQVQKREIQQKIPLNKKYYLVSKQGDYNNPVYKSPNGYYFISFYLADEKAKQLKKPNYYIELRFRKCEINPIIDSVVITAAPAFGKSVAFNFMKVPLDRMSEDEMPPRMEEMPPKIELDNEPTPPPMPTKFNTVKFKRNDAEYIPWE